MNRIIILATNDFASDQRVLKSAGVFGRNNFQILLLGRQQKNTPKDNILPYPVKLMRLIFLTSALFYAEFNLRAFVFLLFARYTHVLANDTDTLVAAFLATKLRGKKLIFDAHELFPEVPELQGRGFVKNFWVKIEDAFFPRLVNAYTVCGSIAAYYYEKYGIEMKVVRNIPELKAKCPPALSYQNKKILLYQGALNKGRGLEWMIASMPLLPHCQLVIIGSGDVEENLHQMVDRMNLHDRVSFLGRIPASELFQYTVSADLGLCLLENTGLSYYYSLPNRIFDFIHAGVPVLATRFPEIESIVGKYRTGLLVDSHTPEYLAEIITGFFSSDFNTTHFEAVAAELCWENESKVLTEIIRNIR